VLANLAVEELADGAMHLVAAIAEVTCRAPAMAMM
jgi:hypothetical protein